MLTVNDQSQLAEAMAQMMRSCVLAATRTWTAPALQGLSMWSEMLAPGAHRPVGSGAAGAARDSYSSYRSGGGHAVAQVIVAGEDAALAGWAGVAGLTPMYDMLDAWRATFGAGTRGRN